MNYARVLHQYDEIAATKGKAKQPLIVAGLKDPDFLRVTQYILDSRKTFKISKVKLSDSTPTSMDVFEFLDFMDNKKAATKQDREYLAATASGSPEKFAIVNKILRHKTDAGFTNKTMNKLSPGLIPYFPYMRCKTISYLKNIVFPCYSQLKADGMYHEDEEGDFRTRNGKELDFSLVPVEHTHSLSSRIVMGEAMMLEPGGSGKFMNRRDGNALINKAQHSDLSKDEAERIRLFYWDVENRFDKGFLTYDRRFRKLGEYGVNTIDSRIVGSIDEAWEHYDEVRLLDLEGTILKNFDGKWKDGDSSDQVKLKAELECELEVFDTVPGKDKYEGQVGSLMCRSSCGGLITDVGMGLSDADRLRTDWPGMIITVKFNETSKSKTKDTYAMSHARLIEPREDKYEADSLEYILELKEIKRK